MNKDNSSNDARFSMGQFVNSNIPLQAYEKVDKYEKVESVSEKPKQTKSQKPTKKLSLIIAIIALVVVLALAITLTSMYFLGKDNNDKTNINNGINNGINNDVNDDSNNGETDDSNNGVNEEIPAEFQVEMVEENCVLVKYTGNASEVVIPNAITSIGTSAFYDCDSITSATIPDSVTSIGHNAFSSCSSLTSVNYLGTIEEWCGITFSSIDANPLNNGAKLYLNGELVEDLVIPNTVTEIKAYAFYNCDSITSVTIPDSVISIGSNAFSGCDSLSIVYYNGTEEEWSGISIGDYNYDLTAATRYYYSETEPVGSGNYWHYVGGVATPW